jgi:hypothetical protein
LDCENDGDENDFGNDCESGNVFETCCRTSSDETVSGVGLLTGFSSAGSYDGGRHENARDNVHEIGSYFCSLYSCFWYLWFCLKLVEKVRK